MGTGTRETHLATRDQRGEEIRLAPGMVAIKFQSEYAKFQGKLESSLVRFLAHDFLDGPSQRRAFFS